MAYYIYLYPTKAHFYHNKFTCQYQFTHTLCAMLSHSRLLRKFVSGTHMIILITSVNVTGQYVLPILNSYWHLIIYRNSQTLKRWINTELTTLFNANNLGRDGFIFNLMVVAKSQSTNGYLNIYSFRHKLMT